MSAEKKSVPQKRKDGGEQQEAVKQEAAKPAPVTSEEFRLSFTATEAYKMLRTKLNLILPREVDGAEGPQDGHVCRIIGLTSALRGEGKSTTAMNLCYTIAEAGHRVCIVEADMRLPTFGKRLVLESAPGLSNILTSQCTVQEGIKEFTAWSGVKFSVITAGDIPPTPSELLESRAMERLLATLSKEYDFIIIDLPPASLVTDALSVSKLLDGMLLVIRQDYCDKRALKDVLYQFKLTETKVLGIVYNCSEGFGGRSPYYRKKRRFGKSYYQYGYEYGYGYGGKTDRDR